MSHDPFEVWFDSTELFPSQYDAAKAAWIAAQQPAAPADTRQCTCHPDDSPPVPCAKKYALSECKAAPRAPLNDEQIMEAVREADLDWHYGFFVGCEENRFMAFARAIEAAHGIREPNE